MNELSGINTLLIDLDDTVFDFGKAEAAAIRLAFRDVGIEPSEDLLSDYSRINRGIWTELERGEITREFLLVERFRRLYEYRGIKKDPSVVAKAYPEYLAKGHYWLPGAREALVELSGRYDVYIASNGTTWIQRSRIATSDLESLVKGIFISQEMGADKPSPVFFENCLKIMGRTKDTVAMVGDSLTSDILGGKKAGLKTVWINTRGAEFSGSARPDMTANSLSELARLLTGEG